MADSISLSEWSRSGATKELHDTIKRFNTEASRQTRQLLIQTWVIAALTAIMAVGVVDAGRCRIAPPPRVDCPRFNQRLSGGMSCGLLL